MATIEQQDPMVEGDDDFPDDALWCFIVMMVLVLSGILCMFLVDVRIGAVLCVGGIATMQRIFFPPRAPGANGSANR